MKSIQVSRNDQVFQLSLTEIAFTVSFILLLLLGYLVFKAESERRAAEEKLAGVQGAEQAAAAMQKARQELQAALATTGASKPEETITRLVEAERVRQERDALRQQLRDADAKLTALVEIQKRIDAAAPNEREGSVREAATQAIAFQAAVSQALNAAEQKPSENSQAAGETGQRARLEQVKNALETFNAVASESRKLFGAPVTPDQARSIVRDARAYRDAFKSGGLEVARKENSDLRGQVAFLKNRLNARGGRDYPPCWADESGKPQFLAAVELRSDGISVTRDWQDARSAEASKLPGFADFVGKIHSHAQFPGAVQPIFNWSRHQDPECRHYVLLRSTISDAVQSDRARLMVENFFYKSEARR